MVEMVEQGIIAEVEVPLEVVEGLVEGLVVMEANLLSSIMS